MITSDKNNKIIKLSHFMAQQILALRFASIHLHLPTSVKDFIGPFILCGNHCSEWDALLVAYIAELWLKRDCYALVKASSMQRYKFLRKLGCFEMDASNPYATNISINYAADLVKGHQNRSLIAFPQGEIHPWSERPLRFQPGVAHIARKIQSGAILPIGIKYENVSKFGSSIVLVSVGLPRVITSPFPLTNKFVEELQTAVVGELNRIEYGRSKFRTILRGLFYSCNMRDNDETI